MVRKLELILRFTQLSETGSKKNSRKSRRPIAFVWDNFGPGHADRCDEVAKLFAGEREVYGIELVEKSAVYDWDTEGGESFRKITVLKGHQLSNVGIFRRFSATLNACIKCKASDVFLCHYENPATFLLALTLRLLGRRTYIMNDSKFDDYKRYLWRELGKRLFYFPYWGGIASGIRSNDYIRFLGIREDRIRPNYNSLSVERIRRLSGTDPAPLGVPFTDRHFTIISRLVSKKNLFISIDAYKKYRELCSHPRALHLCGSGPLEGALREYVSRLGLDEFIVFRGFVQTEEVCRTLGSTLATLLLSTEEQFGNVIIESQAMGVPVIVSTNCGARDHLVRTGVNGFIVEPDNPEGAAFFMNLLSCDQVLWQSMCTNAQRYLHLGDVAYFADAVLQLVSIS